MLPRTISTRSKRPGFCFGPLASNGKGQKDRYLQQSFTGTKGAGFYIVKGNRATMSIKYFPNYSNYASFLYYDRISRELEPTTKTQWFPMAFPDQALEGGNERGTSKVDHLVFVLSCVSRLLFRALKTKAATANRKPTPTRISLISIRERRSAAGKGLVISASGWTSNSF